MPTTNTISDVICPSVLFFFFACFISVITKQIRSGFTVQVETCSLYEAQTKIVLLKATKRMMCDLQQTKILQIRTLRSTVFILTFLFHSEFYILLTVHLVTKSWK